MRTPKYILLFRSSIIHLKEPSLSRPWIGTGLSQGPNPAPRRSGPRNSACSRYICFLTGFHDEDSTQIISRSHIRIALRQHVASTQVNHTRQSLWRLMSERETYLAHPQFKFKVVQHTERHKVKFYISQKDKPTKANARFPK